MKKILFLCIPLMGFFSCEVFDDNDENNNDNSSLTYNCVNNDCYAEQGGQYATLDDCLSICNSSPESILGTWIDKIEGGWVVTINGGPFTNQDYYWSGCYQIELVNSNEALYSGFDSNSDWQTTGMIGSCAGHQASWGWDEGAAWYIWPIAYHELLTFYEDGSFVVQKSPVLPHYYDENNELVRVDYWDGQFPSNLSLGSILESPDPYNQFTTHKSGTWSYDGDILDLSVYGYTFAVELNGNSLTLDRSLVGLEELITTWERL